MAIRPVHVLLIEDNPTDAGLIRQALARERAPHFSLQIADRLSTGLKHLEAGGVDLVLLDLLLPDSEGLKTLVTVREHAPQVPIVVLTSSDDDALALQALQEGAQDYLVKGYVQVDRTLLSRSMRYAIERQRAEEEVRKVHAQTEKLLASIPSILIGVSAEGLVTHWNAVAEATFGVAPAEVMSRPLVDCPVRWDASRLLDGIATCRGVNQPTALAAMPYQRADGREGFVEITVVPMSASGEAGSGVLLFGADVTGRQQAEMERARLQEELGQAQKMETIGRFAGGIAHDFNNFLQVILGFTWLIRSRVQGDPTLLSDLEEIIHASESASGMVRQLLAFSRRQPLQLKAMEFNQTIRNMERLLRQLVGDRIQVRLQLAADPLVVVKLDPTGLEQILMNLCANARDSMPTGGILTIRTGTVTVDDAFLATRPWVTNTGSYVQLSIKDTGTGMDSSVAAHIFEPFFTTKPGRGAGLGLAVVYGLVKQHEGFIDVETARGQGTTFHLYFPYRDVPSDQPAALPKAFLAGGVEDGTAPAQAGKEKKRVLVVDDNASILLLCERILKVAYQVTSVASAAEALEAMKREPYDLVLTDLRMPNMDGVALVKETMKLQPPPRVLAMTGLLTSEMQQRLRTIPLSEKIIRKPFTAPALLEAVNRCLS